MGLKSALYDWGGLNAWLFHAVNGNHSTTYGDAMLMLNEFGNHQHYKFLLLACAVIWLLAATWQHWQRGTDMRALARQSFAFLIALVMALMLLGLFTGLAKLLIPLPRPFLELWHNPQAVQFFGAYPPIEDYYTSFPAPAPATCALVIMLAWPHLPRLLKPVAVMLPILFGWAALVTAIHYPADVIGGILLGTFAGWAVRRYVYRMMAV